MARRTLFPMTMTGLLVLVFCGLAPRAYATDASTLDPAFATDGVTGWTHNGLDDWTTDVVTAADGDVVVAFITETANGATGRRPAVTRFEADGTLTSPFGPADSGFFEIPFDLPGNVYGSFVDVALKADGTILVSFPGTGGSPSSLNYFVVAVKPDGSAVETSFGLLGVTAIAFDHVGLPSDPGDDWPYDMTVQPDGKIVVVGSVDRAGDDVDFGIARFDADGGVDSTFSSDGKVTVAFDLGGDDMDHAFGVAIASNFTINVAGSAETTTGYEIAVVNLASDGSLFTLFGSNGTATFQYEDLGTGLEAATSRAWAITADDGGRVYLGGETADPSVLMGTRDMSVLCLTGVGTPCSGFGVQGWTLVDHSDTGLFGIGETDDRVTDLAVDPLSGSLVLVGVATQVVGNQWDHEAVARLDLTTGVLDGQFSGDGHRAFADYASYGVEVSGAVDDMGRVVMVAHGQTGAADSQDVKVRRLLGGTLVFADGFESGGTAAW